MNDRAFATSSSSRGLSIDEGMVADSINSKDDSLRAQRNTETSSFLGKSEEKNG